MIAALVNHLWQSTVFAALAGVLALALRNNHAAPRYGLWLAASLKFLVPFAVLVALGSHVSWRSLQEPARVERVTQPFAPVGPPVAPVLLTPAVPERASDWSALLLALWASGLVLVMRWFLRWRRIQRAVRTALPMALATPLVVGMLNAPPLRAQAQPEPRLAFEAASIKESKSADPRSIVFQFLPGGRFISRNLPLIFIVASAYDLPFLPDRFTGGPDWIRRDPYDIEATAPGGAIPAGTSAKDRNEKIRLMLQALLADRFHLVIHSEMRDLPRYAIVVAKGGPKLEKAKVEEKDCAENPSGPDDPAACHIFTGGQGRGLHGQAVSLSDLVRGVAGFTDRPVVDQTGLSGLFNIQTEGWVPMRPRPPRPPSQEPTAEDLAIADPARPTLFQILDRLGLKLEPQRGPVEMFVIESAARPSEN